jgi:uncharacterized RDD family membrane protein YckC
MPYPSVVRRYVATLVDVFAILGIIYLYVQSPLYPAWESATAAWPLGLFVLYEPVCDRYFTTLGQFLMRFRVRTIDGLKRVPLWRGFVRVIFKYLLGVVSFVRMPIQKQRRAFHDIISGTIAIDAGQLV